MFEMIRSPKQNENGEWVFSDYEVNEILLWADAASELFEAQGYKYLANRVRAFHDRAYGILKDQGFYEQRKGLIK